MKSPVEIDRISGLDGIRGLAAFSVLLYHFSHINLLNLYLPRSLRGEYERPFIFDIGQYGVEAFFVLSGFLIPLTLGRRHTLRSFFIARFIRLFPIFWMCALITLFTVYFVSTRGVPHPFHELIASFTMIPRQILGAPIYLEGVYWTLEVELFFYVLIGCLFYAFGRSSYVLVFFTLSVVGICTHVIGTDAIVQELPRPLGSVFMRFYGLLVVEYANLFLAGIIIFIWYSSRRRLPNSVFLVPGLIFCVTCQALINLESAGVCAVFFTVFVAAISSPVSKVFSSYPLLFLGYISYPLYLIHMTLGRSMIVYIFMITGSEWVSLVVTTLAIVLLSFALTRWIDDPLRRYLNKTWLGAENNRPIGKV